jgi:[protein-PII] uridylyltransferase
MAQQRFASLLRRLKEQRQAFTQTCRDDVPGLLAARTYARHYLDNMRKALTEGSVPQEGWALLAVGGFGRGELSFSSDLDLLFLYKRRLPQFLQEIVRELVYGLWDGGFEVGHSTASASAVKSMAQDDFTILTSYLETQFIAGDEPFYEEWRKSYMLGFGSQTRRRFLQNLIQYREGRLLQYGESSYLLEPHVKEGVGGLRDLHVIRWAGTVFLGDGGFKPLIDKGWLTAPEELWLEQAYDFLWRVRLQLHLLTGRRQDQLLFSEQEQIASRLGFLDGQQGSAVEAFMRLYYRHTARIRRTSSFFLERLQEAQRMLPRLRVKRRILPGPLLLEAGHIHFMEPEWVKKDARLLMQFFWQAAISNAHFHHHTGHIIRENLDAFTDDDRRDSLVVKKFMDILLDPEHAFPVLKVMLETGFLQVFIPELTSVRYRVQHDVYHLYTVDEHLLRTVRELHTMERQADEPLLKLGLSNVFAQIKNRRVLFIAALLHDIGKGKGTGHAVRGAEIARTIGRRLGLKSEETELLCFLIKMHLILADTALKRDLMDEKPIVRCAVEIGDREKLHLLYLLTIADSRATGPGAWNTWKASLLRELFFKVDRLLLRGDWQQEDLTARCEEIQGKVLELVAEAPRKERVAQWLDTLSFRYLLSQNPEAIVRHFGMEEDLSRTTLTTHACRTEGEMWQITVATRDRPGLFAIITGVLWARGLNILSADIFTRQSGIALDIIIVERLPDPLHSAELWDRVERDLAECLKDRTFLHDLLANKRRPSLLQPKCLPRKEDRVVIDEEASDFYTIIEVYTWDRPGVLHAITNTLYELSISIQLAKISTPGAQVADVFYVTDLAGEKLADPELHEKVRKSLLECLATAC